MKNWFNWNRLSNIEPNTDKNKNGFMLDLVKRRWVWLLRVTANMDINGQERAWIESGKLHTHSTSHGKWKEAHIHIFNLHHANSYHILIIWCIHIFLCFFCKYQIKFPSLFGNSYTLVYLSHSDTLHPLGANTMSAFMGVT